MKIKNALLSTAAATASLFAIGATAQAATVTVKAGDTVSAIAADHNTTIDAIQQANHLKDVNLILVGQQLEVNGDSTTTTSTSTQTTQQTTTTQSSAQTSQTQAQPSQASQTQSSQTQTSKPAAQTMTQRLVSTSNYSNNGSDSAAKAWIAGKESGGSYSARNGQYFGKYQLSASYLNGDYSAANQERVANSYVASRYGSWSNAKSHWLANGWY
ncbi:aggregation-promoting factor [Lactiplantibacillus plantarum]|uniref:aggregation-promoting factor n=1 Tax=Lactiplantibacillus plantarum TaxID=1590 RepID=UPI0010107993|nr:LysM domain-containing protein [Lactiplantibacillus plantarum]RXS89813.1 LysM domain-containing protein [Lactiplantibacillus plantarum]